jgi:hypothetical protein
VLFETVQADAKPLGINSLFVALRGSDKRNSGRSIFIGTGIISGFSAAAPPPPAGPPVGEATA